MNHYFYMDPLLLILINLTIENAKGTTIFFFLSLQINVI